MQKIAAIYQDICSRKSYIFVIALIYSVVEILRPHVVSWANLTGNVLLLFLCLMSAVKKVKLVVGLLS